MVKNGTFLNTNPGIAKLNYYDKIQRTGDLLKSWQLGANISSNLLISNFYIAPASVRFDQMVEEAIYELNAAVSGTFNPPEKKDDAILNLSIEAYLEEYASKESGVKLRNLLQKNGFSGELIKVAAQLNGSTMDQLTRAILSEEGIFFYLAYRTIRGNEIKDVKGIASNMLDALGLVKSYINTTLVDKVIAKENLRVNAKEKAQLKDALRNKNISYFQGGPEKTVTEQVDNLKSGGTLFAVVTNFLDSGKVNLPHGTDKAALAQKMVDYLLKLGYNENFDQPEEPPTEELPTDDFESDDFQNIENVGPTTNEKFKKAGIRTFSQLAKLSVTDLKAKLVNPLANINYDSIIEQAKLINAGSFKELIKYQEKLNKRTKNTNTDIQ